MARLPERWEMVTMTNKPFTHAEVDALVAAAVALVVQKAADFFETMKYNVEVLQSVYPERKDGKLWNEAMEFARKRVLTFAKPNALTEHDAALREALKLQTEVFREQKAKLEAENAGLREALRWAMDEIEHYKDELTKAGVKAILIDVQGEIKARALLGEQT